MLVQGTQHPQISKSISRSKVAVDSNWFREFAVQTETSDSGCASASSPPRGVAAVIGWAGLSKATFPFGHLTLPCMSSRKGSDPKAEGENVAVCPLSPNYDELHAISNVTWCLICTQAHNQSLPSGVADIICGGLKPVQQVSARGRHREVCICLEVSLGC